MTYLLSIWWALVVRDDRYRLIEIVHFWIHKWNCVFDFPIWQKLRWHQHFVRPSISLKMIWLPLFLFRLVVLVSRSIICLLGLYAVQTPRYVRPYVPVLDSERGCLHIFTEFVNISGLKMNFVKTVFEGGSFCSLGLVFGQSVREIWDLDFV